MASGVVLWDQDGRTCGGTAKWFEFYLNPLAAEALACCDGMQLAKDRSVNRILLEMDCQVLVSLWVNRPQNLRFLPFSDRWRSSAGALIVLIFVSLVEVVIS